MFARLVGLPLHEAASERAPISPRLSKHPSGAFCALDSRAGSEHPHLFAGALLLKSRGQPIDLARWLRKEQVLTCMGPPATKAAEGQTEVWSYDSGDGATLTSGSVSRGGGFSGVSSSRFCHINVVMSGGAVAAVNYQGPTGGLITAGEQCAYAVNACVRRQ